MGKVTQQIPSLAGPWTEERARLWAADFAASLREDLNECRVPIWLEAACVRMGVYGNYLVVAYRSPVGDRSIYEWVGGQGSDLCILFEDYQDIAVDGAGQAGIPGLPDGLLVLSTYGERSVPPEVDIGVARTLVAPGRARYSFVGLAINASAIGRYRYLPLIMYVPSDWVSSGVSLKQWTNAIAREVQSMAVDAFAKSRLAAMLDLHGSLQSVIVLGSYKPTRLGELAELRDRLQRQYEGAFLLVDMPGRAEWTPRDKFLYYASRSRFAIMVDSDPSGHMIEYELLGQLRLTTAILRKGGVPTSGMMSEIGSAFMRAFSFKVSPLEGLEAACQWAERQIASKVSSLRADDGGIAPLGLPPLRCSSGAWRRPLLKCASCGCVYVYVTGRDACASCGDRDPHEVEHVDMNTFAMAMVRSGAITESDLHEMAMLLDPQVAPFAWESVFESCSWYRSVWPLDNSFQASDDAMQRLKFWYWAVESALRIWGRQDAVSSWRSGSVTLSEDDVRSAGGHPKVSGTARNAKCPCGSGRKFKNCCGKA